ncbi:CBS domain-containing protein [Cellvibrio sp. OA-2007]|uniref:CBS domain-containing protein n=1 Tax=Cellvibrio sp. OA-2007 TaxID=529823 RepID=UPI00078521EF|nr:CBS domain-containing protein [Cellvibrio sp. OA-2007]
MNTTNTSGSCAKDIMSSTLLTAYEGWTISRLADFFINRKISAAPVIASDHELVGVVSISDVFKFNNLTEGDKSNALRNHYRDSCGQEINEEVLRSWVKDADKNCTVHQIMTHEVIAIDQRESIKSVAQLLLEQHLHRVFVTDNNKVIGVITAMDVLAALAPH